jgi:hypothetical protein
LSPQAMLAPKRPREQGVARLLNQHSDSIQTLVGSEKQHRHNVHSEYSVQAGFVAYCRCCRIVVHGNCKRHQRPLGTNEQRLCTMANACLRTCDRKTDLEKNEQNHLRE